MKLKRFVKGLVKKKMISIIVPVYNVEKYLSKCLQSICNQTYENIEILLADDGSTDCSGEICNQFAQIDNRIRVFHLQNGGSTHARNACLAHAKGDYIGFVDSDDWIEKNMYQEIIDACMIYDADIAICRKYINHEQSEYVDMCGLKPGFYINDSTHKEVVNSIIYNSESGERGISPNLYDKLFKKELIYDIQMANDERIKYGEDDVCVNQALLKAKNIVMIDKVLYHYRIHSESVCRKKDDTYFENISIFYHRMREAFENHLYSEMLLNKLNKYMLEFALRGINSSFGFANHSIVPFYRPETKVLKNIDRIILYGAGNVGQDYYRFLSDIEICEIVAWVDKRYAFFEKKGLHVLSPDILNDETKEYILLAVESADLANRIKKELLKKYMISESKIIWHKPKKIIDTI